MAIITKLRLKSEPTCDKNLFFGLHLILNANLWNSGQICGEDLFLFFGLIAAALRLRLNSTAKASPHAILYSLMLPVHNTYQKATQTLSFLMCASCLFVNHFLVLLFFCLLCQHCEASFCRPIAACRPWRRTRTAKWLLRHWLGAPRSDGKTSFFGFYQHLAGKCCKNLQSAKHPTQRKFGPAITWLVSVTICSTLFT